LAEIYDKLQAMVGSEEGPFPCTYEVNKPMIQHWCKAMEDNNPLYTDEAYAKKSKYGGIVAPPAMVQVWSMERPQPSGKEADAAYQPKLYKMLADAGYTATVATNNSLEFFRMLRIGERLSIKSRFASVSPEKTTRTGVGFFVVNEKIYLDSKGEVVCIQPFTTFHFKPAQRKE
jgi:uncharacterized protein